MKVSNTTENLPSGPMRPTGAATDASRTPTASGDELKAASATDKVELSATSRSLTNATGSGSEVRADKVAEVRKAIAEGNFHVNAEVIADRLIAEAAELIELIAKPAK